MSLQCETSSGSRPQEHRYESVRRHLFLRASTMAQLCNTETIQQRPYVVEERSKPGCRIVVSATKWELTTRANIQLSHQDRLVGSLYYHSGFLGSRTKDIWNYLQGVVNLWARNLSISLSAAAFLPRAGSSILAKTWNHGSGVGQSVSEISCIVEFGCELAKRVHTGAQCKQRYSYCRTVSALTPQLEPADLVNKFFLFLLAEWLEVK